RRGLHGVGGAQGRTDFGVHAVRVIVVRTAETAVQRLRGVGRIVVGIEAVLECVVVRLRLDVGRLPYLRLREKGRVLHVPVRPSPVAVRRNRRVVVDVERRAFFTELLDVVEGVLVVLVRRERGLYVEP